MAIVLDPEIWDKVEKNKFILGMSSFCIGIVFNLVAFLMVILSGLIRQSTGIYLLFLTMADTLALIFGVLMDEFYDPLIDVNIFADSDDPKALCQATYFLKEMFYYWRWFLVATIIVDRCLVVAGRGSPRLLSIVACIFSLAWMLVSGGLAGYWIHYVEQIPRLFSQTNNLSYELTWDEGPFNFVTPIVPIPQAGCRDTLPCPGDHKSTEFYMYAVVSLFIPDLLMVAIVLISVIVLAIMLRGRGAKTLEPDDINLTQAIAALGFVNFFLRITSTVISGIILFPQRAYRGDRDVYGLEDDNEVHTNLAYTSRIAQKVADFALCVTFFLMLFSRRFRSVCCKD